MERYRGARSFTSPSHSGPSHMGSGQGLWARDGI